VFVQIPFCFTNILQVIVTAKETVNNSVEAKAVDKILYILQNVAN